MAIQVSRLALVGILLAGSLLSTSAEAQSSCRVLDPELVGSYVGGCKDGLADGYGEAKGSASYRGGFRAGRKHGHGVKIWPTGDRYDGGFVDDRKDGQGTYIWGAGPAAGDSYQGGFAADRRQGFGTYTWASGGRYSGQWLNDEISGPPTAAMLARSRAQAEEAAAMSQPGVKVCREMLVGIAERDWIRGLIVEVEGAGVRVRIEDAGRFAHVLNGQPVVPGAVIRDSAAAWTPCV